jgi:hypothetical protein
MRTRLFGGILATVLLLGALGAIGYSIFQTGYEQGLVENADLVAPAAGVVYYPGWWGFGVFGIFFKVLFLLLIIGFVSRLFFWRRGWTGPRRGVGPYRWTSEGSTHSDQFHHPMGSRFAEWHQQMHDAEPGDGETPSPDPERRE